MLFRSLRYMCSLLPHRICATKVMLVLFCGGERRFHPHPARGSSSPEGLLLRVMFSVSAILCCKWRIYCFSPILQDACLVFRQSSGEEDPWEDQLAMHQHGERRAAFPTGLRGQGAYRRSRVFHRRRCYALLPSNFLSHLLKHCNFLPGLLICLLSTTCGLVVSTGAHGFVI